LPAIKAPEQTEHRYDAKYAKPFKQDVLEKSIWRGSPACP